MALPEPTHYTLLKAAPHPACSPADPSPLKVECFCNIFQPFADNRLQALGISADELI